jgi:hypothetical protein
VLDVDLPSIDLFGLPPKGTKALFDLVEPFENLLSTGTTMNWSVEEALCLKDEALLILVEPFDNLSSMDATTNWRVEEAVCLKDKALFVFASEMLPNETFALFVFASALSLNETFVVEVTGTFTAWEWTQRVNPELRLERKVVKGTRADALKLLLFWPMPIGFGPCQSGWVFDELWSSLRISSSLTLSQYITCFDDWLTGSNATSFNHFVVDHLFDQLVRTLVRELVFLLVFSLASLKKITWLIRTWVPATKLRLVNAFACLAKKKNASSTKNFETAGVAFNSFLFIAVKIIF